MTQNELNRIIAQATGESVSTISQMGFVLLTPIPFEREPQTVDWDAADVRRIISLQPRRKRPPAVV